MLKNSPETGSRAATACVLWEKRSGFLDLELRVFRSYAYQYRYSGYYSPVDNAGTAWSPGLGIGLGSY